MATDMGRGIMAPDSSDNISTSGVDEMRTLAATAANAIVSVATSILTTVADKYVEGEEIRRIITSPNPELGLQAGELLLVTETPKWFTDFHDTPIGEPPINMTDMWDTSYTREVIADDTALGGKALRLSSTGAAYRLLAIPVPEDLAEPSACDMMVRWRAPNIDSIPRLLFWGSGEPGSENGFHSIYRTNGQLSSARLRGGYPGTNEGAVWTFTPNQWYITRVRIAFSKAVDDIQFNVKMFQAGRAEPHSWGHRTTNELETFDQSGAPGIYFRGPGEALIDWIGVSWDTGKAPRPEVI